jgi:nucleoside 2-deoxyribosyltransferase
VPLLKEHNAVPVRIDRQQHNDDINNIIIAELTKADFVIADLTYARPSVYYEAGFAQRSVPVVYTCRKDHFRNQDETLRVHFDLQMKNIVPWESPTDRRFKKLLAARLRYTLAPIRRELAFAMRESEQEREFGELSMDDRARKLLDYFKGAASRRKYSVREIDAKYIGDVLHLEDLGPMQVRMPLWERFGLLQPGAVAIRSSGGTLHVIYLRASGSITQQFMRNVNTGVLRNPVLNLAAFTSSKAKVRNIKESYIFRCDSTVPLSRITLGLKDFAYDSGGQFHHKTIDFAIPTRAEPDVVGIFALSQFATAFVVVRRNPDERYRYLARMEGRFPNDGIKSVGRFVTVKRHVRVYVMDNIRHSGQFKEAIKEKILSGA